MPADVAAARPSARRVWCSPARSIQAALMRMSSSCRAGTQWSATGPGTGCRRGRGPGDDAADLDLRRAGCSGALARRTRGPAVRVGSKERGSRRPDPRPLPGSLGLADHQGRLRTDVLLNTFGGCAGCELPNNVHYAAGNSLPTIAHQRDLSGPR